MASRLHRFRHFATVWIALEQLLFGGVFFGWGSLVFVLKDEGIYSFLCNSDNKTTRDIFQNVSEENINSTIVGQKHAVCTEQNTRLNLWFTIAISVLGVLEFFIGVAIYKYGERNVRIFGLFIFSFGSLSIAFADKNAPWLILPGLFALGVGGVINIFTATAVIPIQYKRLASSVTSLLNGLFNSATVVNLIVKIAYERGITRQTSYIFLTVLQVVMITFSTLFFFEKHQSSQEMKVEVKKDHNDKNDNEENVSSSNPGDKSSEPLPLKHYLLSPVFLFHNAWFSLQFFYMITFIGLVNSWFEQIFNGNSKQVSHFTDVFYYITTCAFPLTVIGGLFLDWQRMLFKDSLSETRRHLLPGAVCLGTTTAFAFLTTIMKPITTQENIYASFVFFIIFKEFMAGQGLALLITAFPIKYFGVFYGILFGTSGLLSLLQYGIFNWMEAYTGSDLHANIFFICLQVILFANPINMFIQSWRSEKHIGKKESH